MLLYTRLVHLAIADMAATVPALAHIDPARVLVVAANRHARSNYGNLAQCIGLGLDEKPDLDYWYNPRTRMVTKATHWYLTKNTRVLIDQRPMRYIVRLRLPRLLKHKPLETIVHELMHFGPDFDGRLNDQPHGKTFERWVKACAKEWRRNGNPELVEQLDSGLETLTDRFGSLVGLTFVGRFITPRKVYLEEQPPLQHYSRIHSRRLRLPAKGIPRVAPELNSPDTPSEFTERELVYRVFSARRSQKIATAALRSSTSLYPSLQGNDGIIGKW
jgi:predicted metallopeptidase